MGKSKSPKNKDNENSTSGYRNKFNVAEKYLGYKYEFRVNTVALTIEYREKGKPGF